MTGQKIPDSKRWKHRRKAEPQATSTAAPTLAQPLASSPYDQARIGKWICDRIIDWRGSCWRCRLPILPGQAWLAVGDNEVQARFHRDCHSEWLVQQEALARKALGLTETMR